MEEEEERGFALEVAYEYACKHLLRVYPACEWGGWAEGGKGRMQKGV